MADPYAERRRTHAGAAPGGEPPWAGLLAERGGLVVTAAADLSGTAPGEHALVAVRCRGAGLLPAILRPTPAQAAMLLAAHADDAPIAARVLNEAHDALAAAAVPLYAIKHGLVAGPEGEPGAVEVDRGLVESVLAAEEGGGARWERDPDFGYEVAAEVPGLERERALALCPRLLYAAHDRVYEHAELVAEVKRGRARAVGDDPELAAEIRSATGWPIEPTGERWKD